MTQNPDVVVIGAGAAGIIAAWRASTLGAKVVLLEKNDRIGIKILISGGGKCNITHDGPLEDLIKSFRPNEARFIRPACYRFDNRAVVELLTSRGLDVYTRPDGRIFPVHQTARDVVAILGGYLERSRVGLRLNTTVRGIERDSDGVTGVETTEGRTPCRHVVLAVGGASYPKTGTTGDGYPWVQALGHGVVKVRPALAPMVLDFVWGSNEDRAGVALRDVLLKVRQGKEIARWHGDLLFTHHGVSGPCALGVSRVVAESMHSGPVELLVDLAPEESFEELQAGWSTFVRANPNRLASAWIAGRVPERLEPDLLAAAEIEPRTIASQLPAKTRNRLIETLKGWRLGRVRHVPIERGEVVAGGVPLDEVDAQTMRSLKCPGLYLCGEVLDVAGPVGGYNLQAAFATGYVAGETAANDALAKRNK